MDIRHFKTLFIDIETVPAFETFEKLPERMQALWKKKALRLVDWEARKEAESIDWSDLYENKAGIFAEFGKVVCISVGILVNQGGDERGMRIKSFASDDEKIVLKEFVQMLNHSFENKSISHLCGHNVREFDFPFLCRRLLLNQMSLPPALNFQGKRPWDIKHVVDTMELWKFGDYKNYTSLDLLASLFDIPSSKDDIDGSEVGKVYWRDKDLDRIRVYCEKDVWVTAAVYLKMHNLSYPESDQITYLS